MIGAIGGKAEDLAYQEPTALGLLLLGATLAIGIWAIADAARRPNAAWEATGHKRTLWIVLLVGGTVFARLLGLGLAVYYLVVMRRRLQAAAATAGEPSEPAAEPE